MGDHVKKMFPFIGAVLLTGSSAVLHYCIVWSDRAAWSLLVGSINDSPWELYKPVGIVYLFWMLIELSCLRPSLKRFVCAKVIGMYGLCAAALLTGMVMQIVPLAQGWHFWIEAAVAVTAAQWTGYRLYAARCPIEILWIPMLLSIMCMVFMLLFLSFYPPDWAVFRDCQALFCNNLYYF